MKNIVYLNGKFLPEDEAKVSVFDRGFLLADGVYEVVPVLNGKMIDVNPFWKRFSRSLNELSLSSPLTKSQYINMLQTLIQKNSITEGGVYTQITRGVAPRTFAFPEDLEPTCMAFSFQKDIIDAPEAKAGVKVVTVEDIRWKRRDVKSIALLGQCMAKEQAQEQGAYEGWMVEDGFVTEGVSSSAYVVKDGIIITRQLSNAILPGVRRKLLLEIAPKHGIKVELRPFTPEEAYSADEAFLTSATTILYPIIEIDGNKIGDGKIGEISKLLRELYIQESIATSAL